MLFLVVSVASRPVFTYFTNGAPGYGFKAGARGCDLRRGVGASYMGGWWATIAYGHGHDRQSRNGGSGAPYVKGAWRRRSRRAQVRNDDVGLGYLWSMCRLSHLQRRGAMMILSARIWRLTGRLFFTGFGADLYQGGDVGADWAAKWRAAIPEENPRTRHNRRHVGDRGDCAGMAAEF